MTLSVRRPMVAPIVRELLERRELDQVVETGTGEGDLVAALLDCRRIRKVWSFERSEPRYHRACKRLYDDLVERRRLWSRWRLHLILGDAAREMDAIARMIEEPSVYVLDSHVFTPDEMLAGDAPEAVRPKITQDGRPELAPVMRELSQVACMPWATLSPVVIPRLDWYQSVPGYPDVDQIVRLAEMRLPAHRPRYIHHTVMVLDPEHA